MAAQAVMVGERESQTSDDSLSATTSGEAKAIRKKAKETPGSTFLAVQPFRCTTSRHLC